MGKPGSCRAAKVLAPLLDLQMAKRTVVNINFPAVAAADVRGIRVVRQGFHDYARGSLIEGTEVHSRGDFVTVISADDLVRSPDAFERQLSLLSAHPEASFCFSGYDKFASETGEIVQEHQSYEGDRVLPGPIFLREYLTRQQVQVLHSGTMLRKSAY